MAQFPFPSPSLPLPGHRHRCAHPPARIETAAQRPWPLHRRHQAAADAACLLCPQSAPARKNRFGGHRSGKASAGRRRGADRERHQPALRAVRRRRIASAGPSLRPATTAGRGPRRLAGPARRGGRRRQPGRGGGRGRTGDRRLAAAAGGRRSAPGHRSGRAHHPSRARRQRRFRFLDREGRARQGVRRGRPRDRGGAPIRAPDGDDAGGARPDRRLRSERRHAHGHSCAPVAIPDAGCVQPPPAHSRAQGAGDRAGHRRRVRHEAEHLFRRDRDGRGQHGAGPTRQILRRPAGIIRIRRPGARPPAQMPDRVEKDRRDPRHGDGRHRRRRRLWDAAALQCRRGHDGDHHHGRPVQLRQLQGPHPQRLRQQEPDRHVSRRRHAARLHRHGTAHRHRRRQARDRHGRVQAPHLSPEGLAAVRDTGRTKARNRLVPRMPGKARGDDRLRRVAQGAAASCASAASIAASASRRSASRPPMGRPITAPPARRSRPRTAARCDWSRRARSDASPASPTRVRAR